MGVKDQIFKLAKKGLTPSQIGVILRDSHGVAQVRFITGNKILRILKSKGMAPELTEDCYHLIKKAVSIRKHLERNRKDRDAKFRLILVESRIHRLARYYKLTGVLPPTWKYESSTAPPWSPRPSAVKGLCSTENTKLAALRPLIFVFLESSRKPCDMWRMLAGAPNWYSCARAGENQHPPLL